LERVSFHFVQRGKEIHTCNGSDEVTSSSEVSTTVELDLGSFVSVVFMGSMWCWLGSALDRSPFYNDQSCTLLIAKMLQIYRKNCVDFEYPVP
jgi:hypothetical protein